MTRTYTATRGGGAFLNGQRISVSRIEQLQRSLLVSMDNRRPRPDCKPESAQAQPSGLSTSLKSRYSLQYQRHPAPELDSLPLGLTG